MPGPHRLTKGTSLDAYPGDSHNAFFDMWQARNRHRNREQPKDRRSNLNQCLSLLVKNDTGEDLTARFPIVRLTDPVIEPADTTDAAGVSLAGVHLKVDKVNADTINRFAVIQGPLKDGEFGRAVVMGATWVKVDVTNEDHTHARGFTDDVTKLTSGGTGALILWKEEGTGTKLAQIFIGAQSPSGDIIRAQVNEPSGVADSDGSFSFDNSLAIVGNTAPGSGGTAFNIYGEAFDDNEVVFLAYNEALAHWETIARSGAGSQLIHFHVTLEKGYAFDATTAEPVGGGDPFYVVDPEGRFYLEAGYQGHAVKFTDDYDSTGLPGYRIIECEGPAHIIAVLTNEPFSMSGTECNLISEQIFGRPSRGIAPETPVTVHDDLNIASQAQTSEKWLAIWDEMDEHYIFASPMEFPKLSIIRAQVNEANHVIEGNTTFDFDNGTALTGVGVTSGTAVNPHSEWYEDGEWLTLVRLTTGEWLPFERPHGAWFKVTTEITAASWSSGANELTDGVGAGKRLKRKNGSSTVRDLVATAAIPIKNGVGAVIPVDRIIHCTRVGVDWYIDIDSCGLQ